MTILQTISGMSASSGGPTTCTNDIMNALYEINAPVDLLTLAPKSSYESILGYNKPWLKTVEYDCRPPFLNSRNFQNELIKSNYDLYHSNGLWMGINHTTCAIARKKKKKYIISPHGMLYPNALHIHYWKKWLLLKLWYKEDILKASCLHATCLQEANYIRTFGYNGPIAIIGNAVVIPETAYAAKSKPNDKIYIGFLGRLHPIKRIELILYGIKLCKESIRNNIKLLIMGDGSNDYKTFLKNEIDRLGLKNNIEFQGFIQGDEKYEKLRMLRALFVPSESENFGMIVPEALICGTPVFASTGTPWEQLNEVGCGWWMDATPQNIKQTLEYISTTDIKDIINMGLIGRNYIQQNFSPPKIASEMLELYDWVCNHTNKPSFIKLL